MQVDVDENAELDEENAEGKLRFSGGHGEAVTYDDGDDEDKRIRAAAAKADDALADEVRSRLDATTFPTSLFSVRICDGGWLGFATLFARMPSVIAQETLGLRLPAVLASSWN